MHEYAIAWSGCSSSTTSDYMCPHTTICVSSYHLYMCPAKKKKLVEWVQQLNDPQEFLHTVKEDLFEKEVFVFSPKGDLYALKLCMLLTKPLYAAN